MQFDVRVQDAPAIAEEKAQRNGCLLDLFGPTILKSFADDVIVYVPGMKQ